MVSWKSRANQTRLTVGSSVAAALSRQPLIRAQEHVGPGRTPEEGHSGADCHLSLPQKQIQRRHTVLYQGRLDHLPVRDHSLQESKNTPVWFFFFHSFVGNAHLIQKAFILPPKKTLPSINGTLECYLLNEVFHIPLHNLV